MMDATMLYKSSMLIAFGLTLASGVAFAAQSVYDDLGVPQTCREDTAFWTLTSHAGPTVDAVQSSAETLDAATVVSVQTAQPLADFDSRWWSSGVSAESDLRTFAPGFLLFLR